MKSKTLIAAVVAIAVTAAAQPDLFWSAYHQEWGPSELPPFLHIQCADAGDGNYYYIDGPFKGYSRTHVEWTLSDMGNGKFHVTFTTNAFLIDPKLRARTREMYREPGMDEQAESVRAEILRTINAAFDSLTNLPGYVP